MCWSGRHRHSLGRVRLRQQGAQPPLRRRRAASDLVRYRRPHCVSSRCRPVAARAPRRQPGSAIRVCFAHLHLSRSDSKKNLCAPPKLRVAFALRVRSHAHHCALRLGSLVLKGHPFLLTRPGQTRQTQGKAHQWVVERSQCCPEKNACISLFSRDLIRSLCLALSVSRLRLMCDVHVWLLSFGVGPDWAGLRRARLSRRLFRSREFCPIQSVAHSLRGSPLCVGQNARLRE